MNILFIETAMYPNIFGGAEIFDFFLIQELLKNYNVEYIGHEKQTKFEINGYLIPKLPFKILFNPLLIMFTVILHRKKVDLIHVRFSRSKWLNWWPYPVLKKIFKIPYIITIHGGGLSRWRFPLPYKLFFQNSYKILGVSKRICTEYMTRTGLYVEEIVPLIPFKKSELTKDEIRKKFLCDAQAFVFLFIGSLKSLKNPHIIIEAFQLLGESYASEKKIQIYIVGDGPLRLQLEKSIGNSFMENHIVLTGKVDRENIADFYKMSDAYIITSAFEGTPISMLEAMFNNIPIIASNSPGLKEIILHKKNGYIIKNNSSLELSNLMKYIIENEHERSVVSCNAKNTYIENYSYKKMLDIYKNSIEELKKCNQSQ